MSLAITLGFVLIRGGAPIVFEGRTVDQWLDCGYEDASRALHELGPAAVPAIFGKLQREHPRYGFWERYKGAWEKVPLKCRQILPRPRTVSFDEWRACNALIAIGPRAVPALTVTLGHRNWLVRSTSAQALGLLFRRGADISRAIPALRSALHDRNLQVRRQAAAALDHRR